MTNEIMPSLPDNLVKALPRAASLSNRVTEELEQLIINSHLKAGDRLPAERELARQFGVSRTVIREAVRTLGAKGLLEVRSGSGTTVRSPTAASVSESMALFLRAGRPDIDYRKVLEIRRLLEVEIAGLAAERRTEEDLRVLTEILEATPKVISRMEYVRVDVAFHSALARATQNELFGLLLDSIVEIMRKVREMAFDIPSAPDRAYHYHSAILEQVRRSSSDGAREAMRQHLVEAEDTLLRAMALYAHRGFQASSSVS